MRARLREFSLMDGGLVCCEVRAHPANGATDSRWVGNTEAVTQIALDRFRTSLSTKQHDAYSALLRHSKLPWLYSTKLWGVEQGRGLLHKKRRLRRTVKFLSPVSRPTPILDKSHADVLPLVMCCGHGVPRSFCAFDLHQDIHPVHVHPLHLKHPQPNPKFS